MKKLFLFIFVFLVSFNSVFAVLTSNASISAGENIESAKICVEEMINLNIPTIRVNESLDLAIELYTAQKTLELQGKRTNFELTNQYALDVCFVKDISLKAKDELDVFNKRYLESDLRDSVDVKAMYDEISISFNEERFEDTLELTEEAHKKMTNIEAENTALRLYYDTTTKRIKRFLYENWLSLLVTFIISVVLLKVFWSTFLRIRTKVKIHNLELRKESIDDLIKKTQRLYFESQTMSEIEFKTKINTFKNMIRDINRQIPALKEVLAVTKEDNVKTSVKRIVKTSVDKVVKTKKRVVKRKR